MKKYILGLTDIKSERRPNNGQLHQHGLTQHPDICLVITMGLDGVIHIPASRAGYRQKSKI